MTYVPLAKRSCDDDDDDDDETGHVRPTMTSKWMFVAFDLFVSTEAATKFNCDTDRRNRTSMVVAWMQNKSVEYWERKTSRPSWSLCVSHARTHIQYP